MKKPAILCAALLLVLLAAAPLVGCQQEPAQEPPMASAAETYTNSEYGFSVEYPEGWGMEEGLMGSVVMFAGPSVLDSAYLVNINLLVEQLPESPKTTLEEYCSLTELYLKEGLADYAKIEESSIEISGLPAIVRTVTLSVEYEGEKLVLEDSQAYVIRDNAAYIITYDVPSEFHDEYADCFELVINSLRFDQ